MNTVLLGVRSQHRKQFVPVLFASTMHAQEQAVAAIIQFPCLHVYLYRSVWEKTLTLDLCLCLCAGNGGQDGANLTQIQVSPFHLVS